MVWHCRLLIASATRLPIGVGMGGVSDVDSPDRCSALGYDKPGSFAISKAITTWLFSPCLTVLNCYVSFRARSSATTRQRIWEAGSRTSRRA